jgi:hypothetical protein
VSTTPEPEAEAKRPGRRALGHTEAMGLKLHPDLMDHLRKQAEANYVSEAEYVRQLIIADKAAKATRDPF